MLTGRKPFDAPQMGENPAPTQGGRRLRPSRAVAPESRLSPALESVVRRALEKSPAARFSSALEMKQALERVPEMSSANEARTAKRGVRMPGKPRDGREDALRGPAARSAGRARCLPAEGRRGRHRSSARFENTRVRVRNRIRAVLGAARDRASPARRPALATLSGRRAVLATSVAAGAAGLLAAFLVVRRRSAPPAAAEAAAIPTVGPPAGPGTAPHPEGPRS